MMSALSEAVINGDWDSAAELTRQATESGADPTTIIDGELRPAMVRVGERFSSGDFFLPDMLMAARAMNRALDVLQPLLEGSKSTRIGKVVIGTVRGDVHDIGKNMVSMLLKGTGFDVVDIGADVSEERFVEEVRKHNPDILALSALLTTTMPFLGSTIKALDDAGLRAAVKVVVGGAPVSQRFADLIGADGYGSDAGEAASLCRRLVRK